MKHALFYFNIFATFMTEENIEIAPNAVGVHQGKKYMRKKWKQLYEEYYLPDMKTLDLPHVQRNAFCEIRLRQRPNYERHRKVIIFCDCLL